MTTELEAAFLVPRDRWGRPMIVPPEGGKAVAYTRASTAAKTLDDTYALQKWMQRQVVKGLNVRPDLQALASSVLANGEDKDRLDQICSEAMDAAASGAAANMGTAVHEWTELVDMGARTVTEAPPVVHDDIAAYRHAITDNGIEVVEAETFVVCDDLRIAGSFDRLYRLADGRVVVGDVKTGEYAATYGAGSVAVQMSYYAHGKRYWGTHERSDLHPDLDPSVGLLVHLPQGRAKCDLYLVDLEAGWHAGEIAAWIHGTWRKSKTVVRPFAD